MGFEGLLLVLPADFVSAWGERVLTEKLFGF